jgi:hypothetical protein
VGIGTSSPDTTLHVVGKMKYQDGTQADKRILVSDPDGNASWENLSAEAVFGSGYTAPQDASCTALIATIATGETPLSVAVEGNHAYVVNYNSGDLEVFDITDPVAPSLIATLAMGSSLVDVAIAGDHAYVLDQYSSTLIIVDVSNSNTPIVAATIGTGLDPGAIALSGNYAYVLNRSAASMSVFDISDPTVPTLSATIAAGSLPYALSISGQHAYVLDYFSDMMVFDISTPSAPSPIAPVPLGQPAVSVAASGDHVCVLLMGGAMRVYDVSVPATPTLAATVATGVDPKSVVIAGGHALVVDAASDDLRLFQLFCPVQYSPVYNTATGSFDAQPVNWVRNGDEVSNTNPGNVGIGTSTPSAKLDVEGSFRLMDGTEGLGKVLTSDADGLASWAAPFGVGGGWTLNGNDLSNTNNGNVGIGLTSPTSRLHVAAPYNHGITLNLLQSTNSWGTPAWFNAHRYIQTNFAGNPAEFKQFNVGGGGVSIGYSSVPIYGSPDALYVSGRVGIGTTAPAASLEVNGYTKLGSDAPAIKYKKITGNFPGNVGAYFNVYHGLDPSKILGVDMIVTAANGKWLPHSTLSGFTYEVNPYAGGANQYLAVEAGPSATGLVNAPYTVLITYEQ